MSFFDDASLVFLPSGEAGKDGKAYSMKPTNGNGDFTFSRGSNLTATRVDSNGLIEKGRENLLLQSNTFDTTWTKNNITLTSNQSGYDGSSDAWLLDTTIANGYLRQEVSFSGVSTFSIYAKAGTADGIYIEFAASTFPNLKVDLSSQSFISSTNIIDYNIQDVGNGWSRVSFTISGSHIRVNIKAVDSSGSVIDGTLYIQDAQVEQGLVATEYIESGATTGLAGILEDSPRFDYSGGASCPSLLLEPSRTTILPYSEYFQGWHSDNNVSYSVNDTTSPEGLINATKVTATGTSGAYFRHTTSATAGDNTFSIFAKYEDCQYICFRILLFTGGDEGFVWFDIQNGVKAGSTGSVMEYNIEDYGNGWYRCYVVHNVDAADLNGYAFVFLTNEDEGTPVTNGTSAHFYGGQWEAGSYPTSYIPNHSGGSVTRNADSCLINPMDTTYSTNYTFYGEFERIVSEDEESILMQLYDGNASATNQYRIMNRTNAQLRTRIYFTGSNTSIISDTDSFQLGQTIKWAVKYDREVIKVFIDGQEIGSTTQAVGGIDVISLERMKVKQILLFDSTISDANLATLTS